VTHDLQELTELADQVLLADHGTVDTFEDVTDTLARLDDPHTRR
jgi:ABC-type molybdate transport system ATPase subunit